MVTAGKKYGTATHSAHTLQDSRWFGEGWAERGRGGVHRGDSGWPRQCDFPCTPRDSRQTSK